VTVIGELVQTQVGDDRQLRHRLGQYSNALGQDSLRIGRLGPDRILDQRDPEQHQPTDTGGLRLDGRLGETAQAVLYHPRHRGDRTRFVQTLHDEHRKHQIGRMQPGLSDQTPYGRCLTQPAGTLDKVQDRLLQGS